MAPWFWGRRTAVTLTKRSGAPAAVAALIETGPRAGSGIQPSEQGPGHGMVGSVDQIAPLAPHHGRVADADQGLAGAHGEGHRAIRRDLDQQVGGGKGETQKSVRLGQWGLPSRTS